MSRLSAPGAQVIATCVHLPSGTGAGTVAIEKLAGSGPWPNSSWATSRWEPSNPTSGVHQPVPTGVSERLISTPELAVGLIHIANVKGLRASPISVELDITTCVLAVAPEVSIGP